MKMNRAVSRSCLIFWVACAVNALGTTASWADSIEIGALSDDTPASCGCFAWNGSKSFEKGKLIYQELETTEKHFLNMKIDGKLIDFKKSKTRTDKFLNSKTGQTYAEELRFENYSVRANWVVAKVTKATKEDESARSVLFKVKFSIKNGTKTKAVDATGYCGC